MNKYMNTILNIIYFIYIKISSILYRFIKFLSRRNPTYIKLMDNLGDHNKDVILNSELIEPYKYEIVKFIPNKILNILVYTDGARTDILFLLKLYKTIIEIPEFKDLGNVKLVLICTHGEEIFTLSTTFPITPNTTPQDFISYFYKGIIRLSLKGYSIDTFDILLVKTISGTYRTECRKNIENSNPLSGRRSYSTSTRSFSKLAGSRSVKIDENLLKLNIDIDTEESDNKRRDPRRYILPLVAKGKRMDKIAVFDIETFVHDERLYPYAIGVQYMKNGKMKKIIYYYENQYDCVIKNSSIIVEKMVNHMNDHCKSYTIFAHNLGKFDGILMLSSIFNTLGAHSLIIGKDNRIITMKFKGVKLLDSLKIFPMSLRDLAKQFNVETQKGEFDHEKVNINNVCDDNIKNEVLIYLNKDLSSLYECMVKASEHIFNKYKLNVTDIYSASSLAMKHFRTSYLDSDGIPLLPKHLLDIVSAAYFGGISQVYKTYGENLYYYDVNSLYPWAMTQDMPYKYIGITYNPKLEDIFGFAYASIYVPEGLNYKPLPVRTDDGSLSTPSGHILGVYFSEELKYAESLGCQIKVHRAYIFTRKQLFNKYVEDIYKEKAKATGSDRVFVKLLLNGLYGFFARVDEKYIALFLPLDEAIEQAQIYPSHNLILMDDDKTGLLIRDVNPSKMLCESTTHKYIDHISGDGLNRTKSNRAIAAAITAYSRIKIHQFKDICGDVYYSDTDSIVTGRKLSDEYVNNELGFMKNEFPNNMISEGIFISPKLYALRLDNGEEIIKAKGVPLKIKAKLNFESLLKVHRGEIIEYKTDKLFKSLNEFSIFNREVNGTIKLTIPAGKIPIYDNEGYIKGYNDVHKSIYSTLKVIRLKDIMSRKMKKLIDKYKDKVNS